MTLKRLLIALAISGSCVAPATATTLLPGTSFIPFSLFDAATQGTVLASKVVSGQAFTFAGDVNLAVYKNTTGTLDFYYQFHRTGAGSMSDNAVDTITGQNFRGFTVNAQFSDADLDGDGIFTASNNPGLFGATAERDTTGSVVSVDFAQSNPIAGTETSATYIFRTNATNFAVGTFGVIDGSTLQGLGFQPAAGAVPESGTWAMFMVGFGAAGAALRGSRRRREANA